jgi:hypothetical protein
MFENNNKRDVWWMNFSLSDLKALSRTPENKDEIVSG